MKYPYSSSYVKKVLEIAASFVGVKEDPPNSNNVIFNTWYYGRPVSGSAYSWCVASEQYIFDKAGCPIPYKTASCNALIDWARPRGFVVEKDYKPGDLLMFKFPGKKLVTHTGICKSYDGKNAKSYEGNTSLNGSQDNGGAFMLRDRPASYINCAVRLFDWESDYMTKAEILEELGDKYIKTFDELPNWAKKDMRELLDRGIINGGTDAKTDPDDINMFLSDIKTVIINKRLLDAR